MSDLSPIMKALVDEAHREAVEKRVVFRNVRMSRAQRRKFATGDWGGLSEKIKERAHPDLFFEAYRATGKNRPHSEALRARGVTKPIYRKR